MPDAVIEMPRGTFVKRRADGTLDFVSPLPCPYNYGCVPGTRGGDGDPLDAIVLGPRLAAGTRVSFPVVAEVDFVDEGRVDTKLVLSAAPLSAAQVRALAAFFRIYAVGKRGLAYLRGRHGEIRFHGIRCV